MAQSEELNEEELTVFVPNVIRLLKYNTNDTKHLTAPRILKCFNKPEMQIKMGLVTNLTGIRLRKVVNYIRTYGIAPIMSGSKGYYYSNDNNIILSMAESLESRASSITAGATGLRNIVLNKQHMAVVKQREKDALGFNW